MILWTIITIIVLAGDQISKYMVIKSIGGDEIFTIIPHILDFVYVKNTGAAFSLLSNNIELLSVISSVFCIGVIVYLITQKPKSRLLLLSLALLFGGAAGNVIDRIFRGFVVDFIEVTFIRFPVFNVADIAITIGAALLVVYILFFEGKEIKEKEGKADGENQADTDAE